MSQDPSTFRTSVRAVNNRATKAKKLARYLWDRHLGPEELAEYTEQELRSIARDAGVHPPSTRETWDATAELIAAQEAWLENHPGHPLGQRHFFADGWKYEPGFGG